MVVSDRAQEIVAVMQVACARTICVNIGGWSVASDGRLLVAWPEEIAWPAAPPDQVAPPKGLAPTATRLMADWPAIVGRVRLADLAAFALSFKPTCRECEGAGWMECKDCTAGEVDCMCDCGDEHQSSCDECSGEGEVRCDCGDTRPVTGVVAGEMFDRRLLGVVCRLLPDGEAEVFVGRIPGQPPDIVGILLSSGGVRALLLNLRGPARDSDGSTVTFDVPFAGPEAASA